MGFPAVLLEGDHAVPLGALALGAVLWPSVLLAASSAGRWALRRASSRRVILRGRECGCRRGRRAGRGARRLARLGSVRGRGSYGRRRVRLGRELRGHRVPRSADRRPARSRARACRVLARLDLETFAGDRWIENLYPLAIERPGDAAARRPARAAARRASAAVAPAGRHGRRARGEPDRGRRTARSDRRVARRRPVPRRRRDARRPRAATR